MAQFEFTFPKDILRDFQTINDNADKIFGEMVTAGAEKVYENVKGNVPSSFLNSEIMNCLQLTKVYKTPTDDGINVKVAFYGYFNDHEGRKTPAPLVCNVFEYGRSTSEFPKHPFMRKSFKKSQLEKIMLEVQKKASGGLLDGK